MDIRTIFLAWDGPLLGFRLVGHEVRQDHPSNWASFSRKTQQLMEVYEADLAVSYVWEGQWKEIGKTKSERMGESAFFCPTAEREARKCRQLEGRN